MSVTLDNGAPLRFIWEIMPEGDMHIDRLKDLYWCRQLGEDMIVQGTQANLDDWELFLEQYSTDVAAIKALLLGFEDAWYSVQSKRENE